jgi:predicted ATP-grasp superfamily ATP-dependent carboligase
VKVLLTDGGHKNTLSIIRHLGRMKIDITIIHHKKSFPAYSKYCSKLYLSPQVTDSENYYKYVLGLVKSEQFDLLIPIGASTVHIFSNHIDELRKWVKVEISEFDKIQLALDKNKTYQLAEKIGIAHPKTIYPKSIDEALRLKDQLTFPVIMKSSNESVAKFPTIYIQKPDDFEKKLAITQKLLNDQLPVIQEMVEGEGCGFYAVYNHGEMVRYFMHQRIRQYPVKGGISTCAASFYNEELYMQGKKILDYLEWHGPAMVEFIRNRYTNQFILIEINPKFWGSLDLSMVAGINFPLVLCDMALNREISQPQQYNREIAFQWLFARGGEFERLKEKPLDIFRVIKSLLSPKVKNDFWLRDIKPNIKQKLDLLTSYITGK